MKIIIKKIKKIKYYERLNHCNLYSMESQRGHSDLTENLKWMKRFNKGDVNMVHMIYDHKRANSNRIQFNNLRFHDMNKNLIAISALNKENRLCNYVVSANTIETPPKLDGNKRYKVINLQGVLCGLLKTLHILLFLFQFFLFYFLFITEFNFAFFSLFILLF